MNEGSLSVQVVESASQGTAPAHVSSVSTEVITQNSSPSDLQASSLSAEAISQIATSSSLQLSVFVLEVMQSVPRAKSSLLVSFN